MTPGRKKFPAAVGDFPAAARDFEGAVRAKDAKAAERAVARRARP
ncbi:hypothetical protein [Streptomyces sp. NPDC001717]